VLAIFTGLNNPQLPDGAHVKFTPPFCESFATAAVMPTVDPVLMEVGGVEENVTTMAGDWYFGSPQPTNAAIAAKARVAKPIGTFDRRKFMESCNVTRNARV
jgi:hypothetical protein